MNTHLPQVATALKAHKRQGLAFGIASAIFCIFMATVTVQARQLSIQIAQQEMATNEIFTIAATATNESLKSYGDFPNISGLQKIGISQKTAMSIVNGQSSSSVSVVQNYRATKEGVIVIPAFSMSVNGKTLSHPGGKLKVSPPKQQGNTPFYNDPFADIWGYDRPKQKEDFVEVPDDAFLALTTDAHEVYVGEGFTATLSFLIPIDQTRIIDFDSSIGEQLAEMSKKLKPANCWEENFPVTRLNGERVEMKGKMYVQYKLYQSVFYPFNEGKITFPSLEIVMRKLMVSKNSSLFFGRDVQETEKSFQSAENSVTAKQLPPHPMRDQVNVGVYSIADEISANTAETGESVQYGITIHGQGNISSLKEPSMRATDSLKIFPPNTQMQVNKGNGVVYGLKQFTYYLEPQTPGKHKMSHYFEWIYFNSKEERYDTLRPSQSLIATGEAIVKYNMDESNQDPLYSLIETASTSLTPIGGTDWWRLLGNACLGISLLGAGWAVLKK